VKPAETRYARSGDLSIAYQVLGDGPFDVVRIPGAVSNIEVTWHVPALAAFLRQLGSSSRLITFDKRGSGLSDRIAGVPTLEERMDDVRAVMDAVGSERAAILGISEGGPMSLLFAATYPERTTALVLYGSFARILWAPDYPWGENEADYRREAEEEERRWGEPEFMLGIARLLAPDLEESDLGEVATLLRQSASPGSIAAMNRMNMQIDVRHVLPSIRVPTLVLHRAGDTTIPVEGARYMAERIPGAQSVELPGVAHVPTAADVETIVGEIQRFLAEVWESRAWEDAEPDRVLATVLFTDIVGSTAKAAELGDRGWRELLGEHHNVIRRQLARHRGNEIDTAGDGFFASFDGPARAIRCATAITDGVTELGLEVRAGLHTGECEVHEEKVGGIAVHIGARVAAEAGPGEVLVSSTVKDLVAGSGLEFEDRGAAELKGVPGEWKLFAVKR